MTAPVPPPPLKKTVRGLLLLIEQIMKERGHGQVTVTIRDGQIQLLNVSRNYLPANLPE